jgi:hypothetical protein
LTISRVAPMRSAISCCVIALSIARTSPSSTASSFSSAVRALVHVLHGQVAQLLGGMAHARDQLQHEAFGELGVAARKERNSSGPTTTHIEVQVGFDGAERGPRPGTARRRIRPAQARCRPARAVLAAGVDLQLAGHEDVQRIRLLALPDQHFAPRNSLQLAPQGELVQQFLREMLFLRAQSCVGPAGRAECEIFPLPPAMAGCSHELR